MKKTRWYKEAVVYQVYPYSFKDSNNDGLGDIRGIISKLDYLKELGITAIWFSPLYETPYKDYGYDISDYRKINPDLGSEEDFDELLSLCHEKGMKVIMDMVLNHTSIEHKWFKEAIKDRNSKYRDYYIIQEGKRKGNKLLPPTNWKSTFTGSAWERIEGSDEFYLHLFCVEQADLNWENKEVRKEVKDIIKFWLDRGVDGFRFDVFNMFSKVWPIEDDPKGNGEQFFIDGPRMHEFLNELNEDVLSKYDCFTVGESLKPHRNDALNYVKEDNRELDAIFNFNHLDSDNISKFFKLPFNIKKFKDGLFIPQFDNFDGGWNTLVLENHDNIRSNSRFNFDPKYRYETSTLLPLITFLGFGTPFIYQGEEIGMTNVDFKNIDEMKDPVSHFVYNLMTKYHLPKRIAFKMVNDGARDHARTPMQWDGSTNAGFNEGHTPWQRMNNNFTEINVKKDLESEKSIYRFYQKVISLKKKSQILIYGDVCECDHNNSKIVAYERDLNGNKMFIVGNFTNKDVKYELIDDRRNYEMVLSNYDELETSGKFIVLKPYQGIVFDYKGEM